MASLFDLNILQGSNFDITVIAQEDDGAVIDLTGYSVFAKARFRYSDDEPNVLLDLKPTIPTATAEDGHIILSLTQTETAAFPVFQGLYEVEVIKGDVGMKVITGHLEVHPQITT
jgi:hypothetical protein